jgi:2'-5' RNA ligase
MSYQPILEDADQIASLEGQRFVVLRTPSAIASPWLALRASLREALADAPVFYPAAAHLTLCGFAAGTPIEALRRCTEAWASETPELDLAAVRIDAFPPPAQVASVEIRRTPELVAAVSRLRELAADHQLVVSTTTPLEAWTPRMSLVYGARLDAAAWQRVKDRTQGMIWPAASGTVRAAEILAFDAGREQTGGEVALLDHP